MNTKLKSTSHPRHFAPRLSPALAPILKTPFLQRSPTALVTDPIIQMQPWGRLEATCYSGGKPASRQEYGLAFAGIPKESLAFEFGASRVTSDAQGKITIEKLPPGKLTLIQHHVGPYGWSDGEKTPFEIKPGETTMLTLGASNSTVTAHQVWPPGMQRQANWQIHANIQTPLPVIPSEIRKDPAALKEYVQSDEFKAAMQSHRSYPATVNDDNTILIENIAPGDYQLSVGVMSPADNAKSVSNTTGIVNFKPIASGKMKVVISADQPPGIVDMGDLELKAVPATP